MVNGNGAPANRNFPTTVPNSKLRQDNTSFTTIFRKDTDKISKHLPETYPLRSLQDHQSSDLLISTAVKYIRNLGAFSLSLSDGCTDDNLYTCRKVQRFASNLGALSGDVRKEDLINYIHTRTRFDLEQASALVVSAFLNNGRIEDGVRLTKELGTVLATSCMWIEPNVPLAVNKKPSTKIAKLARLLQQAAVWKDQNIPLAANLHELLPLLIRVRRRKPDSRCLHLPEWLFKETGIQAPAQFQDFFIGEDGKPQAPSPGNNPSYPRQEDSILLSRRHFRHIQQCIFRLYAFCDPSIVLRKQIHALEDKVLYTSSWIEQRVFATDDIALICHYFFNFQRRLQRKVVSSIQGTSFLVKGQGREIYQNNLAIKSTFENVLLDIAESNDEGVIVVTGGDDTMDLIDETCLLMKSYVDIYGHGDTQNLVCSKDRYVVSRGPVDEYNLLCDILRTLRLQANDEGVTDVPGPTYKFLAKDIMHWNDAWGDDAFAGGRKAGWEDWLRKRGLVDGGAEDEGWEVMERESGEIDEKIALPLR